jgi:hypothetical protein
MVQAVPVLSMAMPESKALVENFLTSAPLV